MEGLGIQLDNFIFYVVCFLITMVVLDRFLFKPLTKILSDREDSINKALKEKEEIEDHLVKIEEEAKQIVAVAKEEARNLLEKAKDDIQPQVDSIIDSANLESSKIVLEGKNQANENIKAARAQSEKEAFEIVTNILHKSLANLKLSPELQEKVLGEIIKAKI